MSVQVKINNIRKFINVDPSLRIQFLIDDNVYKKDVVEMLTDIIINAEKYNKFPLASVKISQLYNRLKKYKTLLERINNFKLFVDSDLHLFFIVIAFCIRSNNDEYKSHNSLFRGVVFDEYFQHINYGYDCRRFVLVMERLINIFEINLKLLTDIKEIREGISNDIFYEVTAIGRPFKKDVIIDFKTIFLGDNNQQVILINSKSRKEKMAAFIKKYQTYRSKYLG